MNGRAPQTILTDQNMCLKEAIPNEMPHSKHALCIWLLVAKFPSWFNAILGERYNEWKAEFYRLYNMENVNDFELGWREMVNSFGLHSNRHIANLYAFRNLWALPYLRSHFFAGMTLPGVSKSINSFIQRFLSAQARLAHSIEQVYIFFLYPLFIIFVRARNPFFGGTLIFKGRISKRDLDPVDHLLPAGGCHCGFQRSSRRAADYAAESTEHLPENQCANGIPCRCGPYSLRLL